MSFIKRENGQRKSRKSKHSSRGGPSAPHNIVEGKHRSGHHDSDGSIDNMFSEDGNPIEFPEDRKIGGIKSDDEDRITV